MKKYIVLLFLLTLTTSGLAQVVRKDLAVREYESMVISMENFSLFHGLSIDNLFLYAYDDSSKNWREVPFQIDDKKSQKKYNYNGTSETLDQYDELVFLAKDLGDRVPDGYWINNSASRQIDRYEIEVVDTLWNQQKAWAYLFHSNTISDFDATDYMDYYDSDPSSIISDRVESNFYKIRFWEENGLPIHALITPAGGGNGVDILDRIKFRVKVDDIKLYGQSVPINIVVNETNIHQENVQVREGGLRVIRDMKVKIIITIDISGFQYTYEDTSHFPIHFYPYNFNMQSDNISLTMDSGDIEMKIKLIRTSMDFNANANGMTFYNPFNQYEPEDLDNRNLVNGMGGSNILFNALDIPGLIWFLVSGNQGSVFSTTYMPNIGSTQSVYYYDYNYKKYQSGDQTADGTEDTGDLSSWGDSGIKIEGDNIQGEFSMSSDTYFLPANQPVEVGDTLNANTENPLDHHINPQPFDIISPAVISDLTAYPASDSAICLSWTAPGDDNNTGQARMYDIRYHSTPPLVGEEQIWYDLIATPAENVPSPSEPGTQELFTLNGLSYDTKYYFAIKTYDEADVNNGKGNASPISDIVNAVTLDVELVHYYAETSQNSVTLYWQTASEENNYGFEVQRKNPASSYQTIAFIPGNGTTNKTQTYSYTDSDVTGGTYYYRLKQIDNDGSFQFYEEIEVSVAIPAQFALYQNYPNPFNPVTTLEYDLAKDTNVKLAIYNTKGQITEVIVDCFQSAGHYRKTINASGWSSGVYFVRLMADNQTFMKKMILLE